MATAGFSYEADIAPLRGQNFGGVTSMGLARERALDRENELRIMEIQEAGRNRAIAFQQQQLDLERRAEEARRQREALNAVPDVTKNLTSIMDDPSKDDATKAVEIARYKMDAAGLATVSPTISNLFSTAENTLKARQAQQERVNGLAYALMQTGQTEALKNIFKDSDNPMAGDYLAAAEAIAAARKAESESRAASEEAKSRREQEIKAQDEERGYLEGYMSTLRKLAPPTAKEDDLASIGSLKGGGTAPQIPQAKPFKFSTEDRIELQEMMLDLNPMLENKDLEGYSDENLYRAALRSTTSKIRRFRGDSSGFRKDKFSSKPE